MLPPFHRPAAVDVQYLDPSGARAAIVVAADASFASLVEERTVLVEEVAPYEPGALYKRELPCLEAVLALVAPVDLLVVDAYVTLDGSGRPGLGPDLEDVLPSDSAESLRRRALPGAPHVEWGPTLGPAALGSLVCDSQATLCVHGIDGDGNPTMRMGRRVRTFTFKQRRAIWLRDRGCSFPGCGTVKGCQAHHAQEWEDGGDTDVANGAMACRVHHRLVHQHGWRVRMVDGKPVWVLPSGVPWKAGSTPRLSHGDAVALGNIVGPLDERWDGSPLTSFAFSVYADLYRPAA